MNVDQLDEFLAQRHHIEYQVDEEKKCVLFRNVNLFWYANNPDNATQITFAKLATMDKKDLLGTINRGLEVEQITRITGYFSKVAAWNKGKRAELKDRYRSFDEKGY